MTDFTEIFTDETFAREVADALCHSGKFSARANDTAREIISGGKPSVLSFWAGYDALFS